MVEVGAFVGLARLQPSSVASAASIASAFASSVSSAATFGPELRPLESSCPAYPFEACLAEGESSSQREHLGFLFE